MSFQNYKYIDIKLNALEFELFYHLIQQFNTVSIVHFGAITVIRYLCERRIL